MGLSQSAFLSESAYQSLAHCLSHQDVLTLINKRKLKMAKIQFEYGFDIRGRKVGNRVSTTTRFKEPVELEIREVASIEAPIAVIWNARKKIHPSATSYDRELLCADKSGQMHTKWYEGRHWLRLVKSHSGGKISEDGSEDGSAEFSLEAFKKDLGRGRQRLFEMIGLRHHLPTSTKSVDQAESLYLDIQANTKEQASQAIERLSKDMVIIDGVIHIACAQPGLRVTKPSDSLGIFRWDQIEVDLTVETSARYLDGHAGFMRGHMAYALDKWKSVYLQATKSGIDLRQPLPEEHLKAPTVLIHESIDNNVEIRRSIDTLVKKTLWNFKAVPTAGNQRTRAFFNSVSNQRLALLEDLLSHTWTSLGTHYQKGLLSQVEEMEDCMTIEIARNNVPQLGNIRGR